MAAEKCSTGVYCQRERIFLHNRQRWWPLRVRCTGLSGHNVTVEIEQLGAQPPLNTLVLVGRMMEANKASLIEAIELGRVNLRRDRVVAGCFLLS